MFSHFGCFGIPVFGICSTSVEVGKISVRFYLHLPRALLGLAAWSSYSVGQFPDIWCLLFWCSAQPFNVNSKRFSWTCSSSKNTLSKWISEVCCSWRNYLASALLSGADQKILQIVGSIFGKPVHFPWGLWCPSMQMWLKCKSQTQKLCISFVFTPLLPKK